MNLPRYILEQLRGYRLEDDDIKAILDVFPGFIQKYNEMFQLEEEQVAKEQANYYL